MEENNGTRWAKEECKGGERKIKPGSDVDRKAEGRAEGKTMSRKYTLRRLVPKAASGATDGTSNPDLRPALLRGRVLAAHILVRVLRLVRRVERWNGAS